MQKIVIVFFISVLFLLMSCDCGNGSNGGNCRSGESKNNITSVGVNVQENNRKDIEAKYYSYGGNIYNLNKYYDKELNVVCYMAGSGNPFCVKLDKKGE